LLNILLGHIDMKAKVPLIKTLALASIVILFAGCSASQEQSIELPQVGQDGAAAPMRQVETVRLEGLRFHDGSASLRSDSRPILDAAAQILKNQPSELVYVDAYCARPRSLRANVRLARHRAQNVKAYLATQGVPAKRMIARGFEETVNDVNSPMHENSRVELIQFTDRPPTSLAYSGLHARSLN
jgi:outer membrane protein OmpA-like peptidoglycan-associated protein